MKFKRLFDVLFAALTIILLGWLLFVSYIIATIDTRSNGVFIQKRIGQYGLPFSIFKLKTIRPKTRKISVVGKFFRQYKIDEFPQLWNIFIGNMSMVGPRPDVQGYYDLLEGENRKILELKPGLTSLTSIKYGDEEEILKKQDNPLQYNDKVIFPDKVKMNMEYYYNNSIFGDIKIIIKTIFR